jgi:hypothetical protein
MERNELQRFACVPHPSVHEQEKNMTGMPIAGVLTRARLTRWGAGLLLGASYAVAAQLTFLSHDPASWQRRTAVAAKMSDRDFLSQIAPALFPSANDETLSALRLVGANRQCGTASVSLRRQSVEGKHCRVVVLDVDSANLSGVVQALIDVKGLLRSAYRGAREERAAGLEVSSS